MRNLSLAASTSISLADVYGLISSTATDLDQNIQYIASEQCDADADVEVAIYKAEKANNEDPAVSLFCAFSSSMLLQSAGTQVVSLRVLLDMQQLVTIMRGGDIIVIPLEEGVSDVVGTVEGGILAASWSPDDSSVVLVTGDGKLILMTSTFDVLSESSLHPSEFGEDAPINVGWGSKQTQFHGSLGKSAATAPTKTKHTVSPDDDRIPRISWRGDGAFFSVSSVSPTNNFRMFRVYDRQAILQTTSEDVPGLEHPLAWRPSGNLIASTQRFGYEGGAAGRLGRHDVIFFERNGLRHGEFGLRLGENEKYAVKDLRWSSDSNILAIWIRRTGEEESDLVQLWTTGNYHWYLKQEITAPEFTSVEWHPEKALCLMLTTSSTIIQRTYAWETCSESGSVCAVDGTSLLLTPFQTQNIPPPMSSYQLAVAQTPIHICFAGNYDTLAVLSESGRLEVWTLNTRVGPGRGKVMQPTSARSFNLGQARFRQITPVGEKHLVALGCRGKAEDILLVLQDDEPIEVPLPSANGRLVSADDCIVWQSLSGELYNVDSTTKTWTLTAKFPLPCWTTRRIVLQDGDVLFIGHSESGKLFVASSTASTLIAPNATSFTVASGFLIYTTSAHEAVFAPVTALSIFVQAETETDREAVKNGWEKRRIERGSRIVVSVPSAMSLVLQMPRGNLETIYPRPLIMEVVRQDLDACQYRKAFMACRKHRIDLNVLVDHDQEAFLTNISLFVDQVDEVDFINLFLANVGRSSHTPEVIATLCDAIRGDLERKDLTKYVNSILTAHVVKTPPDHEAGLALLLKLRADNPHLVEEAVKYIIFLVDADKLYNTALGMYDFELVLMIAQHAQKDPREYLPFLRQLRAMQEHVQRFHIDDHLKRYQSALRNLSLAGDDHFDEAIQYTERYQLYETALSIWKKTPRYATVLTVYGDWLFERREFRQAASAFVEASAFSKAMIAYEKALEWQQLFDLAIRTDMPEEDVVATAYSIAEDLTAKKRYLEAGRVLLDYASDVREGVITLTQGHAFAEARRVATLHRKPELLEDVIHPASLESRAQISEDLNEMREQLQKQHARLRELRVKRVEEPDAFFGVEDSALQNVDVMTDVSMPFTAFTRYTVAPTATSRASSKRTSRSKRKQERKVGSGRKGTVDEEDYLVKSVAKLVGRFVICREEARALIPHLFEFTAEHRAEGSALQDEVEEFERVVKEAVEDIWKKKGTEEGTEEEGKEPRDSWAARMEEAERARRLNPVDAIPKPDVASADWRLRLLDFEG